MGRTACTEPQCLYKGTLYLYFYLFSYIVTSAARNTRRQQMDTHFNYTIVTDYMLQCCYTIGTSFKFYITRVPVASRQLSRAVKRQWLATGGARWPNQERKFLPVIF